MADEKQIKEKFEFLTGKILGLLLFGSQVKNDVTRGDIDICIVAPEKKKEDLLYEIYQKVNLKLYNYDVSVFEELPLYMKIQAIENHKVVFAKNLPELYEYFYFFRKLWEDQKHRQEVNITETL